MTTSSDNKYSPSGAGHGSYVSYSVGFLLSLFITIDAYLLVSHQDQLIHGGLTVATIITLAIAQLFVQLICFLHLGRGSKPRWNLIAFCFAALVVLIVVFGSIWIMSNLNYHAMSPADTNSYVSHDEGIKR